MIVILRLVNKFGALLQAVDEYLVGSKLWSKLLRFALAGQDRLSRSKLWCKVPLDKVRKAKSLTGMALTFLLVAFGLGWPLLLAVVFTVLDWTSFPIAFSLALSIYIFMFREFLFTQTKLGQRIDELPYWTKYLFLAATILLAVSLLYLFSKFIDTIGEPTLLTILIRVALGLNFLLFMLGGLLVERKRTEKDVIREARILTNLDFLLSVVQAALSIAQMWFTISAFGIIGAKVAEQSYGLSNPTTLETDLAAANNLWVWLGYGIAIGFVFKLRSRLQQRLMVLQLGLSQPYRVHVNEIVSSKYQERFNLIAFSLAAVGLLLGAYLEQYFLGSLILVLASILALVLTIVKRFMTMQEIVIVEKGDANG